MKRSIMLGWTALALGLAAPAALATAAFACPGGGCRNGKRLQHLERRIESLDLAPQTREAAYELLDRARQQRRAARTEMREGREKIHEMLAQDSPDEDAILAQADALGAVQLEVRKTRLRTLIGLRKLLTAEQWQELQETMRPPHERKGPCRERPGV
jgi:Spy/CpxP family protein refolding chaperone